MQLKHLFVVSLKLLKAADNQIIISKGGPMTRSFDINQFKIYPNPATEFVKFESGNLNDFEVHVFNQNGGLISKLSTNNHQVLLERNNLSKGIYYFSILSGDKVVYTNKFIFK